MIRRLQRRIPAWVIAVAVCVALTGSAVAPASAQSFVFDVGVNFPEYVVLWYWDRIDFQIGATELTNFIFGASEINAGTQTTSASLTGSTASADAGIDTVLNDNLPRDPAAPIWLSVTNAWALRSVSISGQTQVSVRVKRKNARAGGGAKIKALAAQVSAANRIGSTIVVPSTGSRGVWWGSLFVQIDISKASRAGDYNGIEVEIVAENI